MRPNIPALAPLKFHARQQTVATTARLPFLFKTPPAVAACAIVPRGIPELPAEQRQHARMLLIVVAMRLKLQATLQRGALALAILGLTVETASNTLTACTSAANCSDHGTPGQDYQDGNGSCGVCTCEAGYTGDDCGTTTACTNAANCSGNAASVVGDVATGCTCTCNIGFDGDDCSNTLTACTRAADCSNHGEPGLTYQDVNGNCGCTCEAGYTGDNCSDTLTACNSAADCSDHGTPGQDYQDANGSCGVCTCEAGYTGDDCGTTTACTNADNCSGNAASVVGNVATGCTCTCNLGFDEDDCSNTLTACTRAADCSNHGEPGLTYQDVNGNCGCACEAGYTGDDCSSTQPTCTSSLNCNDHGTPGRDYQDASGSCGVCSCEDGYTGDDCGTATPCSFANDCSNQASQVEGDVATGCTCTCNDGFGGADCSTALTACTVVNDCGGDSRADSVVGYSDDGIGCTCTCNASYSGADCSTEVDADNNLCYLANFNCQSGTYEVGGVPDPVAGLPGTCQCVGCDPGYTDGEGVNGYKCDTPNENCTLSDDIATKFNAPNAEDGVYYCANGSSVNTIRPFSDASGRMCGCNCGSGDEEKFMCENAVLNNIDQSTTCNNLDGCLYDGTNRTCQPNESAFSSCTSHTVKGDCDGHSECLWNVEFGKCTVSEATRTTCLAKSDSECLAQGSGCTIRGECNVDPSKYRTGFGGGGHCEDEQDAILTTDPAQEDAQKGIIYCGNKGVATGLRSQATCVCHSGYTGAKCEIAPGGGGGGGALDTNCPDQDASCDEETRACCKRPVVHTCTAQDNSVNSNCTRANESAIGRGESRQNVCESQTYDLNGARLNCSYHSRDPEDSSWDYFDQTLNTDGANRLLPKCECVCDRRQGVDGGVGTVINGGQQYIPSSDTLSCIANCSEISPGDTICDGRTGDDLQFCKENSSPCFGNGECNPATNKCNCYSGWAGDYCSLNTAGFESKDCPNGYGVSDPGSLSGYACMCNGDWTKDGRETNADGVATCNVDPCHQGVTRTVERESSPYDITGLGLIFLNDNPNLLEPIIIKGMGILGTIDSPLIASEFPVSGIPDDFTVVSFLPKNSLEVTAAFETGTPEQQKRFTYEGIHVANTDAFDKILPSEPTRFQPGRVLQFYHKFGGIMSCDVFDMSPGADGGNCQISNDNRSISCGCKTGFAPNEQTRNCEMCPFGTFGPNCNFKMNGSQGPGSMNLCDRTTFDEDTIDLLMLSDAAHGRPARTIGTCSDNTQTTESDCTAAGGSWVAITDKQAFKNALFPDTNYAGANSDYCDVHEVLDSAGRKTGSLDILCPFGTYGTSCESEMNICDATSLDADAVKMLMISDLTHGRPIRTMGTCSKANIMTKARCEAEGNSWSENMNGSLISSAGRFTSGDVAKFRNKLTPDKGYAECAVVKTGENLDITYTCNTGGDALVAGPNVDGTLDMRPDWLHGFNQADEYCTNSPLHIAECRVIKCNRTGCGATDATPDSWHASIDSLNNITGCTKNLKGGVEGTNYACPARAQTDSGTTDYPYAGANSVQMTWRAPAQNRDGNCRSVQLCDEFGMFSNMKCGAGVKTAPRTQGAFGSYRTCLYDLEVAPACV